MPRREVYSKEHLEYQRKYRKRNPLQISAYTKQIEKLLKELRHKDSHPVEWHDMHTWDECEAKIVNDTLDDVLSLLWSPEKDKKK